MGKQPMRGRRRAHSASSSWSDWSESMRFLLTWPEWLRRFWFWAGWQLSAPPHAWSVLSAQPLQSAVLPGTQTESMQTYPECFVNAMGGESFANCAAVSGRLRLNPMPERGRCRVSFPIGERPILGKCRVGSDR